MIQTRINRRSILWSFGGTAVAALVVACGGATPAPTAPPSAPTAAPPPTQAPQAPTVAPTSAPAAVASTPTAAGAATSTPSVSGAAATPTTGAVATPALSTRNLTKESIKIWFQGHVAGGQAEQHAYDQTIATWNQMYPNIKAEYQVVPDVERIQKVTAEVAANQAPDLWRHNYSVIRLWASKGLLLDLTDLLKGFDQKFLPALMASALYKGHFWGLPHTTDTSALFYREDALAAIGVQAPTEVGSSWTFQQFSDLCDKLVQAGKPQFAFTHNMGGGRWVPAFLYAAGGSLVSADFSKIALNSAEGIRTLKFLKDWTDRKWAPPDVWSVWITSRPNGDTNPFVQGSTAMAILGQWNITYLSENIKDAFKWNVTFEPRDKVQSSSLGGTPVTAWAKTPHPQEVAAFAEFFVSPEMMRMFDEMANYLPTRVELLPEKINYQTRPDLMQTFQTQDKSLPADFVSFVARSYSDGVSTIVNEEATKMSAQGQSPDDTAKNIETRGNKFIADNPDVEAK